MEHISPKKTYVTIWVVLMCLTALTALLSTIDLGPFSTPIALLIATSKGSLVVLFFMHVKYLNVKATVLVIVAGLFWLLILLLQSMSDYVTRAWS